MNKVIFINRFFSPDHSATSQILSELAFRLGRSGYDIHIITSRLIYDNSAVKLPASEVVGGVKVTRIWTTSFGRTTLLGRLLDYLSFYPSAFMAILVNAKKGDILVAKTDPPLISAVAAVAAFVTRAKLVNWCQDLFPEVALVLGIKGTRLVFPALKIIRDMALRYARMNVVLGERMRQRVVSMKVEPATVRVIPNWADGETIHPVLNSENPLRNRWALDDMFVVGYSGNFGRAHEFQTILAAAKILLPYTDIAFIFIGSGAQECELAKVTNDQGLTNVRFFPYQPKEQLAYSLSVPDVHLISLQPSLEGLIVPSKLYGILAAGRPILFIGARDGEIASILEREQAGFSFNPGSGEHLAEKIIKLKSDLGKTKSIGMNNRSLFDRAFNIEVAVSAWKELLQSVFAL